MKSNKKGLVILIIIGIVALYSLISGITAKKNVDFEDEVENSIDFNNSSFDFIFGNEKNIFQNKNKVFKKNYIAVLHIEGVIQKEGKTYNQKWILDTIKNLKKDEKNKGILLFINSPGGTVYESDETYLSLIDYKNSTGKPVYAYFGSLAASGGYYIASAADYIFANRNTLTGSIGVIAGQSVDATELMEKIGIKSKTFTAGRNKNMLNYNNPLTEEQEQIMQSIADDAYEQFTGIVATARNMSIEEVKKLADGRIYTANQALKNGLIDEIDSLENAEASINEFNKSDYSFEDFNYVYTESLKDIFNLVSTFVKNPRAEMKLNYLAY